MSHEDPSCSNKFKEEHQMTATCDDNIELYVKNDKTEIQLLESSDSVKFASEGEKIGFDQDDERDPKIKFNCSGCGMEEMVHYYGLEPNFLLGIKFNEPTYILRDPFQPPPPRWKPKAEYFVVIGAHCILCESIVCKDNECSFFYINTYCLTCAKNEMNSFPLDVQQKLRKQLSLA